MDEVQGGGGGGGGVGDDQIWIIYSIIDWAIKSPMLVLDQFRFLGNFPPTPPLNQHFALSEK